MDLSTSLLSEVKNRLSRRTMCPKQPPVKNVFSMMSPTEDRSTKIQGSDLFNYNQLTEFLYLNRINHLRVYGRCDTHSTCIKIRDKIFFRWFILPCTIVNNSS